MNLASSLQEIPRYCSHLGQGIAGILDLNNK